MFVLLEKDENYGCHATVRYMWTGVVVYWSFLIFILATHWDTKATN